MKKTCVLNDRLYLFHQDETPRTKYRSYLIAGVLDAVFEVPIEVLHKFGLRSAPQPDVESALNAHKI